MPGYDECLVESELRARAAYAGPERHYHGQRHLDDCLDELRALPDLDEREERLLGWAILWHDAIHDPRRSDNEERSARLARRELLQCEVDEPKADEVARLILLTKDHSVDKKDRLGALMVSIDLAILGSEPERYRAYARDVRREYSHLSDAAWRAGREGVLKRLLSADPLYPDPQFRNRLEARARRNIEAELSRLREG